MPCAKACSSRTLYAVTSPNHLKSVAVVCLEKRPEGLAEASDDSSPLHLLKQFFKVELVIFVYFVI